MPTVTCRKQTCVDRLETPGASGFSRNAGIDLLRGLSVLLVMMRHLQLRIRLDDGVVASLVPKRLLDALTSNGHEAVFIFFVISGFLIASNTMLRWGRLGTINARAFYARRAARILPCLLILVAVLSALHLAGVQGYVINQPNRSLPRAIVAALGLHVNWYEGRVGYLPGSWDVLWSLSIEEVFYLGFPVVCLLLRRDWLLAPSLVLLSISLPVSLAAIQNNNIWRQKAYLPGMAAIAAGVLGAMIAARFRCRKRSVLLLLCAAGSSGILAVLGFEDILWQRLHNGTMLFLTLSTVCLLLSLQWLAVSGSSCAVPGTGWLRSFGRLSYEIYLTHMFVVTMVTRIFRSSGANPWWGVLWYFPALALSWLLGWLVARYISVPAEQAMRRRLLPTGTLSATAAEAAQN